MQIRTAGITDIDRIRKLLDEQNAFHATIHPGFFQLSATKEAGICDVLVSTDADYLVADEEGEIVGLVEIRVVQTKRLPILVQKTYAHIQEMIVSESRRGRGIGSELMACARGWACERGAQCLRTSVVPTNDRARAFYAKHGFEDIMVSIEAEI
jgi:ribosomal protein S18 acetylase RimI-like enzyme